MGNGWLFRKQKGIGGFLAELSTVVRVLTKLQLENAGKKLGLK